MRFAAEATLAAPTSRDRSRSALYRIADTLGCHSKTLLDLAGSERFPDQTAEMVRLWFKLDSSGAREHVLTRVRSAASQPGDDRAFRRVAGRLVVKKAP